MTFEIKSPPTKTQTAKLDNGYVAKIYNVNKDAV